MQNVKMNGCNKFHILLLFNISNNFLLVYLTSLNYCLKADSGNFHVIFDNTFENVIPSQSSELYTWFINVVIKQNKF